MIVNYRVTASKFDGDAFILEQFETRIDAEAYYRDLQADADGLLSSIQCGSIRLMFEEFLGGQWVCTSKKVVVL